MKSQIISNTLKHIKKGEINMNKTVLIGRITKDLELKQAGNTTVCKFSLAVNRQSKKEGQPEADFISIVVFGKTAENLAKYMGKGKQIAVSGKIQTGSYTDKEGKKVYTTDVIADEIQFLDKLESGQADFTPVEDNDNLPF